MINFVFDYKTPVGDLMFGYQKSELPEIISKLTHIDVEHAGGTSTCLRNVTYNKHGVPNIEIEFCRTMFVQGLIDGYPNEFNVTYTHELDSLKQTRTNSFIVPFESTHFEDFMSRMYWTDYFDFDNCFSERLLNYIINNDNFKILFVDVREGSYEIKEEIFYKIQKWLDSHNITSANKVIFSLLDSNISKKLPNDNRFYFYNNQYYIANAGKTLSDFDNQLNVFDKSIEDIGYPYGIKNSFSTSSANHTFLMYNRNSARLHRPYFVSLLKKHNLLENAKVSLHKSEELEDIWKSVRDPEWNQMKFTEDEITAVDNLLNEYPLIVDESDEDKIAHLHNFVSTATDYESTLFSIVGETDVASDYLFITEKTAKPMMNYHPFFVYGNPFTLRELKNLGFKTFSDFWDESYDNETDAKKRGMMILNEVSKLCSMEYDDLKKFIENTKDICIYNRNHLLNFHENDWVYKSFANTLQKRLV